ncbi:hypothetical protein CROQUDRAFT_89417 [Cronartium quercuum f. sp. fusiforme G11]|uniref:GAG-pre-integrase domain-containing protein n=1 Tax=Cronartium quercuum f. sp. fusiforme G11 TaxID=708437 RepID=A0A9P6NTN6_9BASI|nr:hypothetical protein CROQUDRAFT_89417 [Cronartium quercuum f. sp. fusiforme G11]
MARLKTVFFVIEPRLGKSDRSSSSTASTNPDYPLLLHRRPGHLNQGYMERLKHHFISLPPCSVCMYSKHHRLPFSGKVPRPSGPLEVVHSDLSGRISPVTMVDGYKALVEKQKQGSIKRLVNDNGREYTDKAFTD